MAKAVTAPAPDISSTIMLNGSDLGGEVVTKTLTEWPMGTELVIDGHTFRRDTEDGAVFTGMA